jgi:hypothetical protein
MAFEQHFVPKIDLFGKLVDGRLSHDSVFAICCSHVISPIINHPSNVTQSSTPIVDGLYYWALENWSIFWLNKGRAENSQAAKIFQGYLDDLNQARWASH